MTKEKFYEKYFPYLYREEHLTFKEDIDRLLDEMYMNMQYYMEYCQRNGYVTPQEWIEKHKHFNREG